MYYITKRMEIAGAHRLNLPYDSKCANLHGHNWIITIHCKAKELTDYGMVVDFTHVKNIVQNRLDHQCLNGIIDANPTAENMAKWICDKIPRCWKVEVQESEGNVATYEVDEK